MKRNLFFGLIVIILLLPSFAYARTGYNTDVIKIDNSVDEIYSLSDEMYRFKSTDGLYGYMNENYKITVEPKYKFAKDFDCSTAVVAMDSEQGLIDKTGNIVVPLEYYFINEFDKNGVAVIAKEYSQRGFVNNKGVFLTQLKYDDLTPFKNGIALASDKESYDYTFMIDENFREKSYPQYKELLFICDNSCIAAMDVNNKCGTIDKNGNEVIPFIYDKIYYDTDDRLLVEKDGQWGFINLNGEEIIPIIYGNLYPFINCTLTQFFKDGHQGLMNKAGEIVYDHTNASYPESDIKIIWDDNRKPTNFISTKDGSERARYEIAVVSDYVDGVALAIKCNEIDEKLYYGLVNTDGSVIRDFDIPICDVIKYAGHGDTKYYLYPYMISDSLIAVQIDGKWGYMNLSGEMVIEPKFDGTTDEHLMLIGAENFMHGYAKVLLDGKKVTIDKNENIYNNLDIILGADYITYPTKEKSNGRSYYFVARTYNNYPDYSGYSNYYLFLNDDYAALKNGDDIIVESDGTSIIDSDGNILIENCISESFGKDDNREHLAVSFNADKSLLVKTTDGRYVIKISETTLPNKLTLKIGENEATFNGQSIYNDVAPIVKNNRTMLPARFVAESLGAVVSWNDDKQEVTITGKNDKNEDVTILISIDSDEAIVNSKKVNLDSPAFIENDRTYTPIRFICEQLDATVEWLENEQKIEITK